MVNFIKMFIDFDKKNKKIYFNYYIEENHFVLKVPLEKLNKLDKAILIEDFDLSKYTYLINVE
ncbi:MAG: hypothetical protein ACFFDH_21695, partial [Promethearchaeota archaeon]